MQNKLYTIIIAWATAHSASSWCSSATATALAYDICTAKINLYIDLQIEKVKTKQKS